MLGSPLRVLGLPGRLWGFVSLSSPLPARLWGSFLRVEVDGGHAWLTLVASAVANLVRAPLSYERGAACGAHAPLVTPSVHSIACDRVGIHPWTTRSAIRRIAQVVGSGSGSRLTLDLSPPTRRNVWRRRSGPRCVFFPPPALLHFLPLFLLGSPLHVLGLPGRLWGCVSLSSPLPARLGDPSFESRGWGHARLTISPQGPLPT